jgi:hypothetical protein
MAILGKARSVEDNQMPSARVCAVLFQQALGEMMD